jgi:uroporphyrinogen-III decarboxylase
MAYARPALLERMVARLVEATVRYLSAQTDARAETVVPLSPFDPSRATASSRP